MKLSGPTSYAAEKILFGGASLTIRCKSGVTENASKINANFDTPYSCDFPVLG